MASDQSTARASRTACHCQRNWVPLAGQHISTITEQGSFCYGPRALMSKVRLRIALLPFAWASMALSACGHGDRPSSLVSFGGGGESGRGNGAGHGGTSGDGGAGDEAGAAGEEILPAVPIAIFPEQLQVDVGCGSSPGEASLLIRNAGLLP